MTELRVNPPALTAGASGLESGANAIPEPPAPFTSTGTDALSAILNSLTQAKEAPLITGMPATKAEALATAQKIFQAAGMYEQSDQQIADDVHKALAGLDGGGGAPGAGGANPADAAGQAGQLQQMMGMPMQMAQQAGQMVGQVAQTAGQIPQGITQGVQGGMQQVSQLAGGMGQKDEAAVGDEQRQPERAEDAQDDTSGDDEKAKPTTPDGAAPRSNDGERAPVGPPQSGSAPETVPRTPAQTRPATTDPAIVV